MVVSIPCREISSVPRGILLSSHDGRPTPLGAAFAEYRRIAKAEHLLRVVDPVDDTYWRQMNRQLTVQRSLHKLAQDACATASAPSSTRRTAMGRRISSARSDWSSTPSFPGLRGTSTPPGTAPDRRPRDPRRRHRPALPAQAPQPEPARPLQLHRKRPSRRTRADVRRPECRRGQGQQGRARRAAVAAATAEAVRTGYLEGRSVAALARDHRVGRVAIRTAVSAI